MEKKVSASLLVLLWCVLQALIIDASQKVHVPEMDCSAEANNWLRMCFTHGSKISGSQQYWSLSNNWPWQQQESVDFTSITLFCPFLNHCCTTATWGFFILRAHFLECVNLAQKFPFSFLNLDMVYWIQPQKILPVFQYLKN